MNENVVPLPIHRPKEEPLGPGVHAGKLVRTDESICTVCLADGRQVYAVASPMITRGLLEDCVRRQRLVLIADSPTGPQLLGAIQTELSPSTDHNGRLCLNAQSVEITAQERVVVVAGETQVRLNADGRLRLQAERSVIDSSAGLKVLSALVELP